MRTHTLIIIFKLHQRTFQKPITVLRLLKKGFTYFCRRVYILAKTPSQLRHVCLSLSVSLSVHVYQQGSH